MRTLYKFDQEFPAKYEVCDRCQGEGRHTNPSIDGNGITGSEMQEILADDPDFLEDYMGGKYDVTCHVCHGNRVVLVVDEESCTPEQLSEYLEREKEEYEYQMEVAAERRYLYGY
jgi:hypothetical protein